jgi:DNA-binding MarR family transcriptional regulator
VRDEATWIEMMTSNARRGSATDGRYAYEGLDRVLHEKARLGIMTSLMARPDGVRFLELKRLCALTDGNLSRHLAVLRQAALIEIWKGSTDHRPQTVCRTTPEGRRRFAEYLKELERVVKDGLPHARRPGRTAAAAAMPVGWTMT